MRSRGLSGGAHAAERLGQLRDWWRPIPERKRRPPYRADDRAWAPCELAEKPWALHRNEDADQAEDECENTSFTERDCERAECGSKRGRENAREHVARTKRAAFADLRDREESELRRKRKQSERPAAPAKREIVDDVGDATTAIFARYAAHREHQSAERGDGDQREICVASGKDHVRIVVPAEPGQLRDQVRGDAERRREREENERRRRRLREVFQWRTASRAAISCGTASPSR